MAAILRFLQNLLPKQFQQCSEQPLPFQFLMDSGDAIYDQATKCRAIEDANTLVALDAHQTYSSALMFAVDDSERASALKSRAKASFAVAASSYEHGYTHFVYCIEDLVEAIKLGVIHKSESWVGNLALVLRDVSQRGLREHAVPNCTETGGTSRSLLERLFLTGNLHPVCRLVVSSCLVDFVHKRAILRSNERDWVSVRKWCTSYDSMIQQLPSLCDAAWASDSSPDDIATLRTDAIGLVESVRVMLCQAEAMLYLSEGQRYIQRVREEEWDVTNVYIALDSYRMAAITARQHVVAIEAEARSAIGFIFDAILKQEETAHVHYRESVILATSCSPQTFSSHLWWRKATDFVRRYQQRKDAEEEEKRRKEKQPYLDALKSELEELSKHASDADTLLAYVYKTFRPGGASTPPSDTMRKVILKTIAHFHPDKCSQMERKTQVHYEEVCKHLTQAYEDTK
eukprot:Rmarinus@m.9006